VSVAIKGINKPPCCEWLEEGSLKRCKLLNEYDDCVFQGHVSGEWKDLYAGCPLINLGRHGDLIDKEILKKDLSDFYSGIVTARQLIDAQDVVLEAEEVTE